MSQIFHKRVYRVNQFFLDIFFLLNRLQLIIGAYRSKRVAWSMAEKIMLAVTAVNGCRHCARFHGALAQLSGVEAEEVAHLLQMEIGAQVSAYERPALQFAQEYAQTERNPSSENLLELKRFYGDAIAGDIMLYIRMILLGNLSGNTFDAFAARLAGKPFSHSRLFDEIIVATMAAPILAIVNGFAAWQNRKPSRA
ncbi:MAG: carboxymuconolactone decarboxylase family protein [Deltaproteobacteria bacterium]|nr:carboxymuconolactone decarboxylase family protein [Deltaproteobacteria bacterium]